MEYPQVLEKINTFIFDVDGVLTDGSVVLQADGEQSRTMNIKDGFALQLAVKLGYRVIIISGGKSMAVKKRLEGLGIEIIYMGASDKWEVFDEAKLTYQLNEENIAYMGDDVPDYFVMNAIALPSCPADAAPEIIKISKYVSPLSGGKGCVRDLIEKVLRAQGKWFHSENSNQQDNKHLW